MVGLLFLEALEADRGTSLKPTSEAEAGIIWRAFSSHWLIEQQRMAAEELQTRLAVEPYMLVGLCTLLSLARLAVQSDMLL